MVNNPTHVWIQQAADTADETLEIESADGTKTLVSSSTDLQVSSSRFFRELAGGTS